MLKIRRRGADTGDVEPLIVGLVFAAAIGLSYGINKGALMLLLRAMGMNQPLQ